MMIANRDISKYVNTAEAKEMLKIYGCKSH
jgi:hypothetical protein